MANDRASKMREAAAAIEALPPSEAVQAGMEIIIEAATLPHSVRDLCAALVAFRERIRFAASPIPLCRPARKPVRRPPRARTLDLCTRVRAAASTAGREVTLSEFLCKEERKTLAEAIRKRSAATEEILRGLVFETRRSNGRMYRTVRPESLPAPPELRQ